MSRGFVVLSLVSLLSAAARADGLPPGLLADPDGLEMFHDSTYNSVADEYFITYPGAGALGLRLSPCGEILGEVALTQPPLSVDSLNQVAIGHNPAYNEYLAVVRGDDPAEIHGLYLDGLGQPLSPAFPIRVTPTRAAVRRCTTSPRTIATWSPGASATTACTGA